MNFELVNSENKIQKCGGPKGNFCLLCCCEESSVGRVGSLESEGSREREACCWGKGETERRGDLGNLL